MPDVRWIGIGSQLLVVLKRSLWLLGPWRIQSKTGLAFSQAGINFEMESLCNSKGSTFQGCFCSTIVIYLRSMSLHLLVATITILWEISQVWRRKPQQRSSPTDLKVHSADSFILVIFQLVFVLVLQFLLAFFLSYYSSTLQIAPAVFPPCFCTIIKSFWPLRWSG